MINIKAVRQKKNLTMKQVADAAGVSESLCCLIENGKRTPSVQTAKKIASVLDFDWTEFFAKEDAS